MQEIMIGLQFSALIPVIIILIYKPTLNVFFKLLFVSILLSIFCDIIGTALMYTIKNNIAIYCIYCFLNALLITFLWQKVPFYTSRSKTVVRIIGFSILGIMILTALYYKINRETLYIISCLNVFLGLIFSLHYYFQNLATKSYTPLLKDPYFITATGYILFMLSTIIIFAAQLQYGGQPFMPYTWVLKQIFYLIYNIIIAYVFYVLYKSQVVKQ